MYDICGERDDGKVLNCPSGSPSIKVYVRTCSCYSNYLCFDGVHSMEFMLYYICWSSSATTLILFALSLSCIFFFQQVVADI